MKTTKAQRQARLSKILDFLKNHGTSKEQSIVNGLLLTRDIARRDLGVLLRAGSVTVQFGRWGSRVWSIVNREDN